MTKKKKVLRHQTRKFANSRTEFFFVSPPIEKKIGKKWAKQNNFSSDFFEYFSKLKLMENILKYQNCCFALLADGFVS